MKNRSDLSTQVFQFTQMAAQATIEDLTSAPELNKLRPYHRFGKYLYLAVNSACDLALALGDRETATQLANAATKLEELTDL